MLLASITEISDFADPVILVALGLVLAALATSLTGLLPVPAPALFLGGAAATAAAFPAVRDDVGILTVERIAVVALIIILFNGGRDIGLGRFRASLGAISSLGLIGTFLTAGAMAVAAHVVLGLDWAVAGVLGAAIAPTDPAVMFSVLGRREVGGDTGAILEGEAGINDPAGIAVLLGMVELATHPGSSILIVGREFVVEMGIGAVLGLLGGHALLAIMRRVRLGGPGLYPVLALGLAFLLYGGTTLVGGSGFFAVFIAGMLLGDADLPYAGEVDRFAASLASLAEVAVFLALGLTIDLAAIPGEDYLGGIALLAIMGLLVRPVVVAATLVRSALTRNEKTFIAWSGLKGAVPILLAAFAVIGEVPDSQRIYDVVFVVVVGSVVLQGGLVPYMARRLSIPMELQPAQPWEITVKLAEPPTAADQAAVEAALARHTEFR